MVTVGNSEEFCGGGTLFLKAFLPSLLLGSCCNFSTKKGMAKHGLEESSYKITVESNVTFPNALRIWEVPGGAAMLLQMEGAENSGSAWAACDVLSNLGIFTIAFNQSIL